MAISTKLFLIALIGYGSLITSKQWSVIAKRNLLIQLSIFFTTANLPALFTNRMSYVDIAWPIGLIFIGLQTLLVGTSNSLRVRLVSLAYLIQGGRMAFGAILLTLKGHFNKELPRYLYQHKRWKMDSNINYGSFAFKLMMQKEILLQAAANIGVLCVPAILIGNTRRTTEKEQKDQVPLDKLEKFGCILWLLSLSFEHTADLQKLKFIRKAAKNKIKNSVCNVGLWNYSRHPNYFFEWMVWNSLIISSIPSIKILLQNKNEERSTKYGIIFALLAVSYSMYVCLNDYTGIKPSEYYSLKKRPQYKNYIQNVSKFFPSIF
eukprot:540083_1